jgi:hypothetical protein
MDMSYFMIFPQTIHRWFRWSLNISKLLQLGHLPTERQPLPLAAPPSSQYGVKNRGRMTPCSSTASSLTAAWQLGNIGKQDSQRCPENSQQVTKQSVTDLYCEKNFKNYCVCSEWGGGPLLWEVFSQIHFFQKELYPPLYTFLWVHLL